MRRTPSTHPLLVVEKPCASRSGATSFSKPASAARAGSGLHSRAWSRFPETSCLHADAETKEDRPQRVVVCFGPEHAPIDKRIVERAIEEAQTLVPKPKIIV